MSSYLFKQVFAGSVIFVLAYRCYVKKSFKYVESNIWRGHLHSLTQLELLGKLSCNWALRNSFPRLFEEDSNLQGSNPWLVVPSCEVVCGVFLSCFVSPPPSRYALTTMLGCLGSLSCWTKKKPFPIRLPDDIVLWIKLWWYQFWQGPNTDLNAAQNHVCPLGFTDGCRCSLYLSLELDKPSSLEGIKRIWFVLWEKAFITHWSRNSEPHSWKLICFVYCFCQLSNWDAPPLSPSWSMHIIGWDWLYAFLL